MFLLNEIKEWTWKVDQKNLCTTFIFKDIRTYMLYEHNFYKTLKQVYHFLEDTVVGQVLMVLFLCNFFYVIFNVIPLYKQLEEFWRSYCLHGLSSCCETACLIWSFKKYITCGENKNEITTCHEMSKILKGVYLRHVVSKIVCE